MLDELRHFLLIVEQGTFTRAAARAHLSQPALTASVRRLEAELGTSVLERGRRGATPTAAGQALVPRARAALAAMDDARRAVREVAGVHAGDVRLGAGATAVTYLLPEALAAFRVEHPAVRFFLREATTPEIATAVEAGELDLGVITPGGVSDVGVSGGRGTGKQGVGAAGRLGLETDAWFADELVLVASPRLAATLATARRREGGRGGAARSGAEGWERTLRFVAFPVGATTRDLLDRSFPDAEIVMELGSIAAVKGNVRAGMGVALVSRSAVVADLRARRLVEVAHPATPIARPMHLVHRGVARLPPAAAALRALLLERPPAAPKRGR